MPGASGTIDPGSIRLARRIHADAGLAHPDQETADLGRQRDGGMGDARPGLRHQAGRVLLLGMCVRTPFLSTTTKAPSRTPSRPRPMNRMDARSLSGIGCGGAIRAASPSVSSFCRRSTAGVVHVPASRRNVTLDAPDQYPTNEQQAASIGLGRPEAAGDGRQQDRRIGHRQYAFEVERRIRHRRRRSLPGDTTLIVPVHSHVAGVNREPGPVSLTPEPRDALIADCGETVSCAQSRRSGSQRIHHDIVLYGTARRRHSAPNHRVGAQRESQTISRFERRRERLRRRNFEQPASILRLAHGQNEEHAGIHFPPQEVATPIRIVGK